MGTNTAGLIQPPEAYEAHLYEQRGDGKWYMVDKIGDGLLRAEERAVDRRLPAGIIEGHVPMVEGAKEEIENPKYVQALKDGKDPLEYLVLSVLPGDALVLKGGAIKYGLRNWLKDKIKATTYVAAILRHTMAWAMGQDIDPESGHHHLYHVRACCAIVLDSQMHDQLIDDREEYHGR